MNPEMILDYLVSQFYLLAELTGGVLNAIGAIVIGIFAFTALYTWFKFRSSNSRTMSVRDVEERIARRKSRTGRWSHLE